MAYGLADPLTQPPFDPSLFALALGATPSVVHSRDLGSGAGPPVPEAPSAANVTSPAVTNAGAAAQARTGLNLGAMLPTAARDAGLPGVPALPDGSAIRNAFARNAALGAQQHHGKPNWGQIIATVLVGLGDAYRTEHGGSSIMPAFLQMMEKRREEKAAQAQTSAYTQALIANGMDPNMATIMAADPSEMAKHIGTRFDASTVDEGSSRYVPNLNGTANVFTAPKTFQNKADVVQMPGSAAVVPPGSLISAINGMGAPVALGEPTSVAGLRSEAEQYAGSLGLQPGTPAYDAAVQDYSLKAYGPSAQSMLSQRLETQRSIAANHDATSRANNIRSTQASTANNRYSVDHRQGGAGRAPSPSSVIGGIMAKQAAGQPLTPAEQATLKDYRTHYRPQRGAVTITPNEPVAHDPRTGRTIVVRAGKWVDAETGKPVQ